MTSPRASAVTPPRMVLAAILAVGAALRFWALGHGIPFAVAADEPQIMERVVGMMKTGDLNPHFFDYPGLYLHVQLAVASIRFLAGASSGMWTSLAAVQAADFYLWARAISALVGTATIWLVYRAGLRWGVPHALLAAGLMAVLPQHVRESHYVLTDVPLTFFTTLTLLLALRAHERPTLRAFAWAGAAAGLAAASKYPGLVALTLPLVAAAAAHGAGPLRLRFALTTAACCVGAFLVAAPYTWLDLPGFLDGFAGLASSYPPAGVWPSWRLYIIHLRLALGWPGLVLLFVGLAIALAGGIRGPGRAGWWCLLVFGGTYFLLIASKTLVFGRYLLPVYPVVSLLAATAVVSTVDLLRRRGAHRRWQQALAAGLAAAILLPPAVVSARFDRRIGMRSTQSLAYAWFIERVPLGSRIVMEGQALWLPANRYHVTHVRRLVDRPLDAYRSEGYDYLIASSEVYGTVLAAPERFPKVDADYRSLFKTLRPLVVFRETRRRTGPELRVYQLDRPPEAGR